MTTTIQADGLRLAPRLADHFQALYDQAVSLIEGNDAAAGFRLLSQPLSALWTEARTLGQADEALAQARAHRLHALVRQDPYTQRAAEKPRGYAGDAVMLDHVYGGTPPPDTSDLGKRVFACTTRSGMGLSVLYRRVLLRSLIDDVVATLNAVQAGDWSATLRAHLDGHDDADALAATLAERGVQVDRQAGRGPAKAQVGEADLGLRFLAKADLNVFRVSLDSTTQGLLHSRLVDHARNGLTEDRSRQP